MKDRLVDVAVPFRVDGSFTYLVDEAMGEQIGCGSVLEVPFRNKSTHAFVTGFPEKSTFDPAKLKHAKNILVAEPLIEQKMLEFLQWVSRYYCHPIGEVLATALPKAAWQAPKASKRKSSGPTFDDVLRSSEAILTTKNEVAVPTLNADQQQAVATILNTEKKPVLLHGVTGSGKTEVYISVLEALLAQGQGGIILVPEIALTPQLVGRFSRRFPGKVAILHSDLKDRERYEQWDRVRKGEAQVVVGARSAVFAPVKNLGVIIVDEEHETSFKQEDSFRYHARDMAVARAQWFGAKVVLGSATPSLESYFHVTKGKYVIARLPSRVMERPLPEVRVVDLREKDAVLDAKRPWISHVLLDAIQKTLADGNQVLIYLNRLGYAHFLFCRDCGHTWRCSDCDVTLTYYQTSRALKCHYCARQYPVPHSCHVCQSLALDTLGVGTEQVEKYLNELFPSARIGRLDRSAVKNRAELEEMLTTLAAGKIDIVVGTQMVAKGHDFPGIALVGILVADAGLNIPDFRSAERTFQVLTQVGGRAGRADIPGQVIIQTYFPEHPAVQMAAKQDLEGFYQLELSHREAFQFPPFSRMALLRFQHRDSVEVRRFAETLCLFLRQRFQKPDVEIKTELLGPSEAPIARVKGLYRWHCLVKSSSVPALHTLLADAWKFHEHTKSHVQLAIDVDPVNSL
jgi:primosomal protein N' (replication factor Y) (superfamily II helicase)